VVLRQRVAYATQPNGAATKYTLEAALLNADHAFHGANKKIGITRVWNDFVPPTTMAYFDGPNDTIPCDKFYLTSASSERCGVIQLAEGYAGLYRVDPENRGFGEPYQLILITQPVVANNPNGFVMGVTSGQGQGSVQLCSFLFDREISNQVQWQIQACGGSSLGTSEYRQYIVDFMVAHELGRQIGDLYAPYDAGHSGDHNPQSSSTDYMSDMQACDPVQRTLKEFCKDNDTNPNNSCVDRLKAKFP
jgi:hypothetical protein